MQEKMQYKHEFELLFKSNYTRLYYYALQFIDDPENCKDIINDVFEKTWHQYETLRKETLTAFLYTNVRNRCIDYLRHSQVESQYAEFHRLASQTDIDNGGNEREERLQRIESVIEEMTDPTKTILKECYYLNKKYQEVADEFGISTSSVKKHIMKALRMLREEFLTKKVTEKESVRI